MSGLGEAIETARRARGLKQNQLADALNLGQGTLSRYESGLREPDEKTLGMLAGALGVTSEFLRRAGDTRGAMAVEAHMRRRATAKPTVWRRLEAKLNMYRMHSRYLLEEVSIRADQSVPTFDPLDGSPPDAARLVRMQWRMPIGPVRHLTGWLESAGCLVLAEDFGTPRVDGLSQWIDDHPVILLNDRSPTDRRRLTLAHELGHLVLHATTIGTDLEQEADAFAAEFLMPAAVIRPELRNLSLGRLHDLKRAWGVSMQALIERAHDLNVITTTQRTNFYKTFSAKGWRTHEPVSDELTPEEPQLPTSITQALLAAGLTQNEIAGRAGFANPTENTIFTTGLPRLRAV
ncbi:MAG TPA: ImmA/IrrE family metallo-endopeptidase [Mycobacteriales bacterium]|nr:ImmA/IrrE family metallo-endopeptidase [Mycobacteriales bacterium]